MKKSLVITVLTMLVSLGYANFAKDCPTLEQQQAAYNAKLAAGVKVSNSSSQQLQCHYQQLAKHYQQLDKDNQQKAKDQQQIDKDKQQIEYDKSLKAREALLCSQQAAVSKACGELCKIERESPKWIADAKGGQYQDHSEKWEVDCKGNYLVDGIPAVEGCKLKAKSAYYGDQVYKVLKDRYKKQHTNRSGGGDNTNPGGGGNDNGFLNPHRVK